MSEMVNVCQDWPARIIEEMVNCAINAASQTSKPSDLPAIRIIDNAMVTNCLCYFLICLVLLSGDYLTL